MAFDLSRVDVWSGTVEDRPGALAEKLGTIMEAGANLDFIIVRPTPEEPGTGVLFVAPLVGAKQETAGTDAGLSKAAGLHTLRLVGPDRPGLGAGIARTLANAGLNINGLSTAVIEERVVFYIRFETAEEVVRASQVLTPKLG